LKKTNIFFKVVNNLDVIISGFSIVALILLTLIGVVMRFALNNPLIWLEEIQFVLALQAAFWGASAAFRSNDHITIEVIVEMFPKKLQQFCEVVVTIVVLVALGLLTQQQFNRSADLFATGRTTNILHIPVYLNYAGVAMACLFMIFNYIVYIIRNFQSQKTASKKGE